MSFYNILLMYIKQSADGLKTVALSKSVRKIGGN
jgi:hypothetical protein